MKVLQVIQWAFVLILWNIVSRICFWRNLSPVFYGDLVYKLRRVKGAADFVSSGSKIVKRIRRRKYDPEIIESTIIIGLWAWPYYGLVQIFPRALHSDQQGGGDYLMELFQTSSEGTIKALILIWSSSFLLLLLQPLDMGSLPGRWSIAYSGGCLYILYYVFMASHLSLAVGLRSI